MPPRKRSNETEAEKLPKKKAREDDDGAANTNGSTVVVVDDATPTQPTGETRSPVSTARVGEEHRPPVDAPSGNNAQDESNNNSNQSGIINGHANTIIQQPPRTSPEQAPRATSTEAKPAPVTPAADPVTPMLKKDEQQQQQTPAELASKENEASDSPRRSASNSKKSASTPWYYSLLFGISALLLLSNVLSLGLWMQSNLEMELQLRELAVAAGAEEDVDTSENAVLVIHRIVQGLAQDKQQALERLDREAQEYKQQASVLQTDRTHWHGEAIRMMSERDRWIRRVAEVERERDEYRPLAERAVELEKTLEQVRQESRHNQRELEKIVDRLGEENQLGEQALHNLSLERDGLRTEVVTLIKQKRKLQEECEAQR